MNEPENPLPEHLKRLLKNSPTYTPPERFYQSVLEKTAHRRTGASAHGRWSWMWGAPVRFAGATLVVMITIWAVKDETPLGTKKAELAYDQFNSVNRAPVLAHTPGEVSDQKTKTHPIETRQELVPLTKQQDKRTAKDDADRGRVDQPAYEKNSRLENSTHFPWQSSVRAQQAPAAPKAGNRDSLSDALTGSKATIRSSEGVGYAVLKEQRKLTAVTSLPRSLSEESKLSPAVSSVASDACGAVSGIAAGGCVRSNEDVKEIEPPTLWTGTTSGIGDRREVVIRNAQQWSTLWSEHARAFIPKPETPYVDFSQQMVIGVWTGTKPSTGYRVELVDIRNENARQRVIYREIAPPVGAMSGAAMTQPFVLRVVPRSDDPVRFEIQAQ